MARPPIPLSHFIPAEHEALARAGRDGTFSVTFANEADARNMKLRLWRLTKSLEAFDPENPLTAVGARIIFKLRGSTLILVDRAQCPQTDVLNQALKE